MKENQNKFYLAASVSLLTFLVYLSSLHHEFVEWDDSVYVFENPYIQSFNMSFLKWAFTAFHAGNWHPLTWISHAMDYAIWGLNPLGHHVSNIVFHTVNTWAVIFLVIGLIRAVRERTSGDAPWLGESMTLVTAGVTGLLFGLHPLHVESVAWVAERKDLLCALFFLLSIMAYMKYATITFASFPPVGNPSSKKDPGQAGMTKPGRQLLNRQYLAALTLFILALMSKPMAVSLPIVLLILDWYPFGKIRSLKSFWQSVVGKLPFIALSLGSSLLTILAQRTGGSIVSMESVPLPTRALVGIQSLAAYLWKMIWPLKLSPFYPYPTSVSLLSWQYLLAIAVVSLISALCLLKAHKQRIWLAAWSYYVITLVPVIGIVQVGRQAMADRYTYLPGLGPFLIAGLATAWVFQKVILLSQRHPVVKLAGAVPAISVLVSLVSLTLGQIGIW